MKIKQLNGVLEIKCTQRKNMPTLCIDEKAAALLLYSLFYEGPEIMLNYYEQIIDSMEEEDE